MALERCAPGLCCTRVDKRELGLGDAPLAASLRTAEAAAKSGGVLSHLHLRRQFF